MFFLMALLLITACDKDDDEDNTTPPPPTFEEQMVGQYALSSGTFNQDVTMYNVMAAGDTVTFPHGSDATQIITWALLDDSPCDDLANTVLDARADFSLFYICTGESNELQMGTWSADETNNSLALIVDTEIGPVPVTITSVDKNDISLTGNIIGLPVPVDLSQPVGATNIQFISVAVEFTIVN